ncbi:cytochrome c [Terriglobus roseus]|uniref:Cytochrome C n=1 Tax=Terriglobus roseus TaxID=392734 RepID=A0A1H4K499_9BACT|nr:cytochrome c [Terriglobus roseus]SEB53389.1 Cytochrome C' [Terriglobus roseus]
MRPWLLISSISAGLALSCTVLVFAAGPQDGPQPGHRNDPVSVQQTMDLLIDPAADALWASVGTSVSSRGTRVHEPRNAAEWAKVARYAQLLVSGAKRLQAPGLPVGSNAHSRLADADTPGTRTAAQIRADIDADPERFRAAAIRLEEVSNDAWKAARKHDVAGILDAGGALDAACEACHAAYWYPRTAPQVLPSAKEFAAKVNRVK